jgi:CheY-like chemotaxis protein
MINDCNGVAGGEEKGAARPDRPFRILVVDDDKEASCAIARALEHLGHVAFCCAHAQDALALIPTQHFDLLLVDYRMPEMTGLDLIAMLRQERCGIPAVMMTGHFATEDRVPLEQLGIYLILRKPITLPQLERALEESLAGTRFRPISS